VPQVRLLEQVARVGVLRDQACPGCRPRSASTGEIAPRLDFMPWSSA